jgi:hypothetical protein
VDVKVADREKEYTVSTRRVSWRKRKRKNVAAKLKRMAANVAATARKNKLFSQ